MEGQRYNLDENHEMGSNGTCGVGLIVPRVPRFLLLAKTQRRITCVGGYFFQEIFNFSRMIILLFKHL